MFHANGTSMAWQDPSTPSMAGDSHAKRCIQTSRVWRAWAAASWMAGAPNLRSVSAATHTSLGPAPAPSTER